MTDLSDEEVPDMSLEDLTTGHNHRGIPAVLFIEDVGAFAESKGASSELLIGAYTELHAKYKTSEMRLQQKSASLVSLLVVTHNSLSIYAFGWILLLPHYFLLTLAILSHSACRAIFSEEHLTAKVPELDKSLTLVKSLKAKKDEGVTNGVVRYNLSDNLYAKAQIDYTGGTVNLWLGANVMLEYTYEEAIEFLQSKHNHASQELETANTDLAFVREQIVTSEVNMSRIYNWDVRRKRASGELPSTSSAK